MPSSGCVTDLESTEGETTHNDPVDFYFYILMMHFLPWCVNAC